jgi:homoserine O-acetyltransferase
MADPNWCGGAYLKAGVRRRRAWRWRAWPRTSPTSRSRPAAEVRPRAAARRPVLGLRRRLPGGELPAPPGASFVDRFDANSYLYITRALDYFDLAAGTAACWPRRSSGAAREVLRAQLLLDWLYPTPESRDIVRALNAAGCRASFAEIQTDKGHDAFFLDEPLLTRRCAASSAAQAQARGLA